MFRCLVAVLLVALSGSALAQGVSRPRPAAEIYLFGRGVALSNNAPMGGGVLAQAITITKVDGQVYGASGGGAGNTVLTVTDGTNTCTATLACASSQALGAAVSFTIANGAGTGCAYAAGATLTSSITTAGCTTTQPTVNLNVRGTPR